MQARGRQIKKKSTKPASLTGRIGRQPPFALLHASLACTHVVAVVRLDEADADRSGEKAPPLARFCETPCANPIPRTRWGRCTAETRSVQTDTHSPAGCGPIPGSREGFSWEACATLTRKKGLNRCSQICLDTMLLILHSHHIPPPRGGKKKEEKDKNT